VNQAVPNRAPKIEVKNISFSFSNFLTHPADHRTKTKVYKYNDQDGLSDLDDSQESSPCPVCISDVTPPPCALDVCMPILICV
jgi:hypothetical protein